MLKLLGYPSCYSVPPGGTISFHISAEDNQPFEAKVVRVICGDCNPAGPGLIFEEIPTAIDGTYQGCRQVTDAGSFMSATVPQLRDSRSISFFAMIWATLPGSGDQTILSCPFDSSGGVRLLTNAGGILALELVTSEARHIIALDDTPLLERQWYSIGFSIDLDAGQAELHQRPVLTFPTIRDAGEASLVFPTASAKFSGSVTLAGMTAPDGTTGAHFNGKIDTPAILRGRHGPEIQAELLLKATRPHLHGCRLAQWDFSREISGTRAIDISSHTNHGTLHQAPARAMKGWNWSGRFHDWTVHPDEYGAVHFHDDDLYDANWDDSLRLTIPNDLASGAYALRISSGVTTDEETREYFIPFFVRPHRRPTHLFGNRDRVAFLAPTASYIAYANHHAHLTGREAERNIGRLIEIGHADIYMHDHPEIGGSLYDKHRDGSGRCYSSRRRPVLNFTSQYHSWLGGHGSSLWQYNADTHLFAWLRSKGIEYDIITDEDLHSEGSQLLSDYRVLLTGTHPEYYSTPMWDALRQWQDTGGRLMYLGANGFYWHIAFSSDQPGLIEVRRAEDGTRTWEAEPGEYYHSSTGELSGLFRRHGKAPNMICGVGFVAQGFDICSFYRRAPDADNPRAAFIFDGVADDVIGDFGLIGGGAAGLELDCINVRLGTPPHTLRLASSEAHSQQVMLVNEEFGVVPPNLGGDQNEKVRADLAFYETPSGGAVFSVGSISWCGSLPVNGFDNNVSRITENVLRRFMSPEPF